MAITPGALNPNLAPLPRSPQEPQKTPEFPRKGPPPSKSDKPQASSQKQTATPADGKALADEGLTALSEELGQLKQELAGLQNDKPSHEPLASTIPKDGFAPQQVAAARQVQQVGARPDSQFQGRAPSRQPEAGLDSRASLVRPRNENATPDDLALLDMSGEQLGEAVDLSSLTDERER